MNNLKKVRDELDNVSSTFCIAKWKQVTIHLENGSTHSCHHPAVHTIPLDELKDNITALHNTNQKKRMRKKMLDGELVRECNYCNIIEQDKSNQEKNIFSDRVYKSKEVWAYKYLSSISKSSPDDNIFPSYVEVSFSNMCNCSCIYCSPLFSKTWYNEIKKFGPYPTTTANRDIKNYNFIDDKLPNPYIKAFWEWWPELYKNLEFFRITGGEPLLDKNTFKILDYIIENPKHNFEFALNSNFCINPKIFNKFIDKCKNIKEKITVYTSCEAKGKKAEYIRPGLNYEYWLNNCRRYLKEIPEGRLTFMCAYNILSISSFKDFLKDVLKLKQEFPFKVHIDIPFLSDPSYLQPRIISKEFLSYVEDAVTFMYKNINIKDWSPLSGNNFYDLEVKKLSRIYHMINHNILEDNKFNIRRKNFSLFIDEHDKRYNTNFIEVFPEYENFYNKCKELN